jgi:hypothetical protein
MANPYYRITVKQTSRLGSGGRGGATKNLLKDWLKTYVDQRGKQEKEARRRALDPLTTRDGEGRLLVPELLEFSRPGGVPLTTTANNRIPFSRTDLIQEENSANLWAGGFFGGQYGLAWRPEQQSSLSSASSDFCDFAEVAQGINRQKEWIAKLAQEWDRLLASPLTKKRKADAIRYAISLDPAASKQLTSTGIPASLALRVILENSLREYAKVEGFNQQHERLGWVAGFHQDKEHLHLHVALFPTTSHGRPLRLSDKQNSAHTGDQHLTRLVAIVNIEAEKFWRKQLPHYHQTPAVQLARLQNHPDPPDGVNLENVLPVYCANNKKLKLFPAQLAAAAFDQLKEQEQTLRDLYERIRVLNNLPDNNPARVFATARRHAREKQQFRPKELQRLHQLRKLCLRQIWDEQNQSRVGATAPDPLEFARLFQTRWTAILEELQHLSRTRKPAKPPHKTQSGTQNDPDQSIPPLPSQPVLTSLLSFAETLSKTRFQTPVTEETAGVATPADYWLLWIKQRKEELYRLVRENHAQREEHKAAYIQQLKDILKLLDQGQAQTAAQALAPLKTNYPLLQLQLQTAIAEAAPSLERTVLRQRLIQEIQANELSNAADPNSEQQNKTERLSQLQGLRLLMQAAQLQKNEDTRLRNTFRTKPATIPSSTPDYLSTSTTGALAWIRQILRFDIRPATTTVINQEISNLSPQEVLLQNPELLWELRQLQRRRQSAQSLESAETKTPEKDQPPANTADQEPKDPNQQLELEAPASSQIRDLLKGFNLEL